MFGFVLCWFFFLRLLLLLLLLMMMRRRMMCPFSFVATLVTRTPPIGTYPRETPRKGSRVCYLCLIEASSIGT